MQFSVDLEALSGGPVCTWEEKAMPGFEAAAKKAIAGACAAVLKAEADLTRWDQIVGDGDCGITQKRGAEKVMEMLGNGGLNAAKPAQMMNDLAELDVPEFQIDNTAYKIIQHKWLTNDTTK